MSQKDEHSKAIEEYSDFVESISDVGGKLHIVTLENQLIVAQFGPGGWIVSVSAVWDHILYFCLLTVCFIAR